MSVHPYSQWPKYPRQLLQFTLVMLALLLLVLWLHVLPRWQVLRQQSEQLEYDRKKFESNKYPMDLALIEQHLNECQEQLMGSNGSDGLIKLSAKTLEMASNTFKSDIHTAYPPESLASTETPENVFVNHASRIDFKDLFDRLNTSLSVEEITITVQSLGLDEESPEPVYQQILKLWTIRKLVFLATENQLSVESNSEGTAAAIRANRVVAYKLDDKDEVPYLLEFPVRIHLSGTMKDFLKFVKSLQGNDTFIPMKRLIIHSLPPQTLPPGETKTIETLHFSIVCSSFFKIPNR